VSLGAAREEPEWRFFSNGMNFLRIFNISLHANLAILTNVFRAEK